MPKNSKKQVGSRKISKNKSKKTSKKISNNSSDEIRKYLEDHSRGCIRGKSEIAIIEKIEISNKQGLEQNNFIYNIGSPLNAYILKIKF